MKNKKYVLLALFSIVASFFSTIENVFAEQHPDLCAVFNRTLQYGDSGQDVKRLQVVLGQEGVAYLNASGYYGASTVTAVKSFQRQAGIYAAGKVGPQTMRRMQQLWCGNSQPVTDPYYPNPGTSLKINIAPTVSSGNNITLAWTTSGATSCSINGSQVQTNGSQNFQVYAETNFTISCTDYSGKTSTKTLTLKPNQTVSAVPTILVSINPSSALINTTATIYWSSTNTQYCTFNGQQQLSNGSQQIYVTSSSAVYTVTCMGNNGQTINGRVSTDGAPPVVNPKTGDLSLRVTTDKSNYNIGDTMYVTSTLINSSSASITFKESSCMTGVKGFSIDGKVMDIVFQDSFNTLSNTTCDPAYPGYIYVTLAPGQSKIYSGSALVKSFIVDSTGGTNVSSIGSHTLTAKIPSTDYQVSAQTTFTIGGTTSNVTVSPYNNYIGGVANISWNYSSGGANSPQGVAFTLVGSDGQTYAEIKRLPENYTYSANQNITSGNIGWTIPVGGANWQCGQNGTGCPQDIFSGKQILSGNYTVKASFFTPANACFGFCQQQPGQQVLGTVSSQPFYITYPNR